MDVNSDTTVRIYSIFNYSDIQLAASVNLFSEFLFLEDEILVMIFRFII